MKFDAERSSDTDKEVIGRALFGKSLRSYKVERGIVWFVFKIM